MKITNIGQSRKAEDAARNPVERRMTHRLLGYWRILKGANAFPSRRHFRVEAVAGLAKFGFTMDLGDGSRFPVFRFVGSELSRSCGVDLTMRSIAEVPEKSLLAQAARRCAEVINSRQPVFFDSEQSRNVPPGLRFRGIVLPFSEDNRRIDFIAGAITFVEESSKTTPTPQPAAEPADTAEEGRGQVLDMRPTESGRALETSLRECRELVYDFHAASAKSRKALYLALRRAYEFAVEAERHPDAYHAQLATAGIVEQERAPFTPLVKLIFGKEYDKTRLSEYAACLAHAKRHNVPGKDFVAFVEAQEGGIKGCVIAERAHRRTGNDARERRLLKAFERLRAAPAIGELQTDVAGDEEFVLLLGRQSKERHGFVEVVAVLNEDERVRNPILRRCAKVFGKRKRRANTETLR